MPRFKYSLGDIDFMNEQVNATSRRQYDEVGIYNGYVIPETATKSALIKKREGFKVFKNVGSNIIALGYLEQNLIAYITAGNAISYTYNNGTTWNSGGTASNMYSVHTAGLLPAQMIDCGSGGTQKIYIHTYYTGHDYLWIPGTSLTDITDADHPNLTQGAYKPGCVYLDGYVFIIGGYDRIYNSDLDNFTSWVATNYFEAYSEPDRLCSIAKHHNHLVVFGSHSIEFYYNAGNPSGTPLAKRQDASLNIGMKNLYGGSYYLNHTNHGDDIYFLGCYQSEVNTSISPTRVFKLSNFQVTEISTPEVAMELTQAYSTYGSQIKGIITLQGRPFLLIGEVGASAVTYSLVYDILAEKWYYWSFGVYGVQISGNIFVSGIDAGLLYYFDETDPQWQDQNSSAVNTDFAFTVTTPKFDTLLSPETRKLDTGQRKFYDSLQLTGYRPSSDLNINVQWSDDDLQNLSTARAYNLRYSSTKLTRLGTARERIFKFSYTGNSAVVLKELVLDYHTES
jgi:hypothetical protein